jgi:hypothetical protein
MTYGEIYNEICENVWPGVAAIPENMPAILRNRIKQAQRMINRDYNFWFSLDVATITTAASVQSYALPADFKEIEKCYFTVDGQSYGTPILSQLDLTDHLDRGLHESVYETEYPNQFRIDGMYLYFYPVPSEIRVLNILYWKFLPLVTTTTDAAFRAFAEDDIGLYCAEALIAYVSMRIKLMQNEWQAATMYKELFVESIEGARQEDKVRRSIPEAIAPYIGNSTSY